MKLLTVFLLSLFFVGVSNAKEPNRRVDNVAGFIKVKKEIVINDTMWKSKSGNAIATNIATSLAARLTGNSATEPYNVDIFCGLTLHAYQDGDNKDAILKPGVELTIENSNDAREEMELSHEKTDTKFTIGCGYRHPEKGSFVETSFFDSLQFTNIEEFLDFSNVKAKGPKVLD